MEDTYLYAAQYFGTQSVASRTGQIVTVSEMKKFIGLWVLAGLDEKLAIRDYWSNHH